MARKRRGAHIDSSQAPPHVKALTAIMIDAECERIAKMSGSAAQLLARRLIKCAAGLTH